jgi:A/G-specific adenine glycosylase
MTELPGTPWRDTPWSVAEAMAHAPADADWRPAGQVRHGFTHFELILDLFAAHAPVIEAVGMVRPIASLGEAALASVMRKCVRMVLAGGGADR